MNNEFHSAHKKLLLSSPSPPPTPHSRSEEPIKTMPEKSTNGGSRSHQRPVVTNPYLKKMAQTVAQSKSSAHNIAPTLTVQNDSINPKETGKNLSVSSKAMTAAKRPKNIAVTPSKLLPSHPATKQLIDNRSRLNSNMPTAKINPTSSHGNPSVTPTPKKITKLSAAAVNKAVTNPFAVKPNLPTRPNWGKPPLKAKPTTLKSQLKSQIAALKNQKKQRLLQKEHEKQMAIKEAERKKREEEMARLAKIREQEREAQEEKRRKKEEIKMSKVIKKDLGGLLFQIVKQVEVRVNWENRRGVPYQVGEALQYLVTEVEKRNAMKPIVVRSGPVAMTPSSKLVSFQQPRMPYFRGVNQFCHPIYHQSTHRQHLIPFPISTTSVPITKLQKPVQPKPLILHANPMDTHSPFRDAYQILEKPICMAKKASESFGVTLRFESRSVLVPRDDDIDSTSNTTSKREVKVEEKPLLNISMPNPVEIKSFESVANATSNHCNGMTLPAADLSKSSSAPQTLSMLTRSIQKPRKKRRRRVNYGVMTVTEASKANFVIPSNEMNSSTVQVLKPGDIILAINGRSVGGMTFSDACKAVSTTSIEREGTGIIHCTLKVARLAQNKRVQVSLNKPIPSNPSNTAHVVTNAYQLGLPTPCLVLPTIPLVPFVAVGNKVVSGEFSMIEWGTLIRSLCSVHRELSNGVALEAMPQKHVLAASLKKDSTRQVLRQRSLETLEMKLAYEGKKINAEMKRLAEKHWAAVWKEEVINDADNENNSLFDKPLTDAHRSSLRSLARPLKGCRCGSKTHELVNNFKCVLYRDVKSFIGVNESKKIHNAEDTKKKFKPAKARSALEAAYIERFKKLRAETEAAKGEVEFVMNMEVKQSSEMRKAVLAPKYLCTMVLSAVASMAKEVPHDEEKRLNKSVTPINDASKTNDIDSDDGSDDEDDLPLNELLSSGSKRISLSTYDSNAKRSKLDTGAQTAKKKEAKLNVLAQVLKHISQTYGHLFEEPSHLEYAW